VEEMSFGDIHQVGLPQKVGSLLMMTRSRKRNNGVFEESFLNHIISQMQIPQRNKKRSPNFQAPF